MKPVKERKRRRLLQKAADRLAAKIREKTTPADDKEPPAPQSGTLSHEKPASRHAVRYNPMTAPNSKMVDTRGVPYEVGPKGQLRRVRPKLQRTMREIKQRLKRGENPSGKRKGTDGGKV